MQGNNGPPEPGGERPLFRRDAIYRFNLRRSGRIEPVTIGSAAVVIAALSGAPLPGAIWSAPCTALSSG